MTARHIFCTPSQSFSTCAVVVRGAEEDGFFGGVVDLVTFGKGILESMPEPGSGRFGGRGDEDFRMLRREGRGKVKEVV